MTLDVARVRSCFPALASGAVFFDNPGGTQVPQQVIDRMTAYLQSANANRGGAFATSLRSDDLLAEARAAVANFVNAAHAEEIVFGANMTSLALALGRSLAQVLEPEDEIVVTRLDHDANISPWLYAAEARGCRVHWLDFDVEDCTLQLDQLEGLLSERTRWVAVGYASNAVGTINPVARIVEQAHQAGAWCFIDAVHFAPHGPIDVQKLDCDFLAMSAYKFFGPHIGVLYGKLDLLEQLPAFKVRPAPSDPPGKFETGTQNHEGIAGTLGALEYLAEMGRDFGGEHGERYVGSVAGLGLELKKAMSSVRAYEMELSTKLLETLAAVPGLRLYGQADSRRIDRRVPTFAFRMEGKSPRAVAEALAEDEIYAWDGNYYALAVTERLGVEESGGMVRVGLAHYNTTEEIERLGAALQRLASR